MGTKRNINDATFDAALQLKDAGAVTASGAATVGAVARVVNVGAGVLSANLIVDIATLDVAGGDEAYDIRLQGSTDPTFATNVSILARVQSGTGFGQDSFGVGRVSAPFQNTSESGEILPYLRAYHNIVPGAGTASINYQAFIGQRVLP